MIEGLVADFLTPQSRAFGKAGVNNAEFRQKKRKNEKRVFFLSKSEKGTKEKFVALAVRADRCTRILLSVRVTRIIL